MQHSFYCEGEALGVQQLALLLTRIFLFENICLWLLHHRHHANEKSSAESAVQAASPFQGSFSCFSLPRACALGYAAPRFQRFHRSIRFLRCV
jgi:hypothetical protein